MSLTGNTKSKADIGETGPDLRWEVVDRIVASQCFSKSERLTSFLRCVCDLAQRGEVERINEQHIGFAVFGRKPDYDPAVDSIVRSHASRLRHRLDQFYAEEGTREEWLLTIPKGSYLPVFHFRPGSEEPVAEKQREEDASSVETALASKHSQETVTSPPETKAKDNRTGLESRNRYLVPGLSAALILLALVALASASIAIRERRKFEARTGHLSETQKLFWSHLFNANQPTLVVNADSGLVLLQGLTKRRVSLPMYLNGTYLDDIPSSVLPKDLVLDMAKRRYTSTVDLTIMSKILRMSDLDLDRTRFVYARDIRPREVKQGNLILLGTYESTPWVQLFEPGMNFYFQNDLAGGVFSVMNRHPKAGEQLKYDSRKNDVKRTVYGLVAYRPSLDGSGKVLILEGQSMAGTETASDFVFDDGYLLPFLRSIQRADGTIPYFELLLHSESMSGEASRIDIIGSRVEDN